ncbi:IclR family transcriptional regulator [Streptomyces sp. NPDC057908]|uniref:IclR family transcriptional regulator n=1 Tax=Streptomyces sp. NPDC057908 TaxID=3346276 RepID=UPI0036EF9E8C
MGRLVPAVTRALDVLELFLHGDGTLFAPEVTRKLQLPRTTVHELLTTLAARSYLVPVAGQPAVLLSALPPRELDARLDGRELTGMTPGSITGEEELRTVLASARERGVAVERRESDPDVSCVAAPVRDRTGSVVAALSISVPMIRRTEEREEELAGLAVDGADVLSGRLGHHEGQK